LPSTWVCAWRVSQVALQSAYEAPGQAEGMG
jgi:hypothetical protein